MSLSHQTQTAPPDPPQTEIQRVRLAHIAVLYHQLGVTRGSHAHPVSRAAAAQIRVIRQATDVYNAACGPESFSCCGVRRS